MSRLLPPAPRPHQTPALLVALALLAGCQAVPAPDAATTPDAPAVAQLLAHLGPDARVVSVVANGSESWEQVEARLQQACRERYPALGDRPVVTMVDRREVRREVELPAPSFGTTSPGSSGPHNLLPPVPLAAPRPVLALKKALATCTAPLADAVAAP